MAASSTSMAKVKRNLFFSGNDDGFSVPQHNDARCGRSVAVDESNTDVSIGGSSFRRERKGTRGEEPQTKKCAVVYLSERHSRLCPLTYIPMVPPVTPEPGQSNWFGLPLAFNPSTTHGVCYEEA